MKQCTKCKEWKELSEFTKDCQYKDNHRTNCKKCYKEYHKEYRKINREERNLKAKIYRKNYKDILKLRNNSFVLWTSSYPEKIKLYEETRQNEEFLEVKCAYCGKWYKPKTWEIKSRLGAMNRDGYGTNKLYCSENCKKECPIFKRSKYPKGYKKATSREVQPELRQLVLARDNYTCQKCEKHQDELKVGLHCHHYEGININPIESADIDSCITLCKKCHKEVHKLPGCNYNDMKCYK